MFLSVVDATTFSWDQSITLIVVLQTMHCMLFRQCTPNDLLLSMQRSTDALAVHSERCESRSRYVCCIWILSLIFVVCFVALFGSILIAKVQNCLCLLPPGHTRSTQSFTYATMHKRRIGRQLHSDCSVLVIHFVCVCCVMCSCLACVGRTPTINLQFILYTAKEIECDFLPLALRMISHFDNKNLRYLWFFCQQTGHALAE